MFRSLHHAPRRLALQVATLAACAAAGLAPVASAAALRPDATPAAAARDAKVGRSGKARRAAKAARKTKAARNATAARGSRRGATLRGSKAAVDRAYQAAKRDGLLFARSRREAERAAREGDYVRLRTAGPAYRLRGVAVPYVRPATRAFVATFGAEYRRACGEPLTVTSALRPTSMHLRNSVQKTVHPTGMAVDLRIPRGRCRGWMRTALLGYERRGVVDATEERRPAHFHVTVFRAP